MIKVSYPAGSGEGYQKIVAPILLRLDSWWKLRGGSRKWPGYDILMLEIFGYMFEEDTHTFTFERDAEYTAFLLKWS